MLAEISFYNVVLFVHIAAVVLAFGVTFSYPDRHGGRPQAATSATWASSTACRR